VSGAWRPRIAELEAARSAQLEMSGARRSRDAEPLEATKGARLEGSGARRLRVAEQLEAAQSARLEAWRPRRAFNSLKRRIAQRE